MSRPTLRRGDEGHAVEELQHRLIVLGYSLAPYGADGDFGGLTELRVKQFQQRQGLYADGIVGEKTWAKLDVVEGKVDPDRGHDHEPDSDEQLGPSVEHPDGPAEPDFPPLIGNAARAQVFGAFSFKPAPTAGNPEGIAYTDDWPDRNIVTVHIPQLAKIPGIKHQGRIVGAGPSSGHVQVHRLIAEAMVSMWQAWEDGDLLHHVITWAGMWNPRFIRGSRTVLSNHAFATAFDINAPWNGLGAEPAAYGKRGSVRELVPIAHDHGFYWGGHFKRRPDGMHFEAARVL